MCLGVARDAERRLQVRTPRSLTPWLEGSLSLVVDLFAWDRARSQKKRAVGATSKLQPRSASHRESLVLPIQSLECQACDKAAWCYYYVIERGRPQDHDW